MHRPWKQLKAEGLFGSWVILHSEEEFDDLISIMKEAQVDLSSNMNSKSSCRRGGGFRYVRRYPCLGKITDAGVPECGPVAHFEEVDICDAREFVEFWAKARSDEKDAGW